MTENTWQAVRAFIRSTVCVKYPVDRITVDFTVLSLEERERETVGRERNHAVERELSDGRLSPSRIEEFGCELSQIIFQFKCI